MEFKRDPRFGRMIPAMVTPFNADLELDLDRAQELADRLVRGGADALIVNGTTGESPTVFYPQKLELLRAVVRAVNGRIPVIANVGDNCTADTVYFAQDAAKQGVDGFMCVVPYYNNAHRRLGRREQEPRGRADRAAGHGGQQRHRDARHPGDRKSVV